MLPAGEHAVLVELADLDAVLALDAAVRPLVGSGADVWGRVLDVVPAARTLLLTLDGGRAGDTDTLGRAVRELAGGLHPGGGPTPASEEVVVPVRYDGPDLDDVARLTGLSPSEVVAAHTGTPWRVAFGGFAPGFAYLVGGDPRLAVPRRAAPRPSVPTGSVGLAGEFSGVYPRSSPGGWRLVGSTDLVLWDSRRDPPALLRPGVVVRFVVDGGPR
ncbi:5-oxoprolinase subunit B family protein [Phycicoccus avicenniae]|uniref:5-oxoprolinase subunit B family protein n=1 Tax=Phycicoccus avicenniae TaxID=2828860 RepID=UPI003D29EF2E